MFTLSHSCNNGHVHKGTFDVHMLTRLYATKSHPHFRHSDTHMNAHTLTHSYGKLHFHISVLSASLELNN